MKKYKVGLATSALVLVASTITVVGPSVVGLTVANAAPSQAPLNLANEQGALWSCAFNPFVPASLPYSFGLTYESLDFVNALQNGKVTPWLASAYAWSNSNKTLTFTIRSGVKWTDGVALSAADVVYTFDLLKKKTMYGKPVTGVARTTYLIGADTGKGQRLLHVFEQVTPQGHAEEVFALLKAGGKK